MLLLPSGPFQRLSPKVLKLSFRGAWRNIVFVLSHTPLSLRRATPVLRVIPLLAAASFFPGFTFSAGPFLWLTATFCG
jgi:hypothetical protein